MTNSFSLKHVLYGLLLVTLTVAPLVGVYPVLIAKLLCFALFTFIFNLLLGYAGLLSFGYAVFFGGVGYVADYIIRDLHVAPKLGLLTGTIAGTFISLIMNLLTIRRQGICFAMITLVLA